MNRFQVHCIHRRNLCRKAKEWTSIPSTIGVPLVRGLLVVCIRTGGAVSISRELVKEADIVLALLRTAQASDNGPKVLVDEVCHWPKVIQYGVQEVRNGLLQDTESKAAEIIRLCQVSSIVEAS